MDGTEQLLKLRRQIDEIDTSLLQLLAQRLDLCLTVGKVKDRFSIPVMQPGRVAEVTERAAQAAANLGLSPEFARDLWHRIILEACRLEEGRPRAANVTSDEIEC